MASIAVELEAEAGDNSPARMSSPAPDPEQWVDDHGDYLFHYALSRLRDHHLAEEYVQECLLAALKSVERFQGRSSERTWLVGILKNKILDHFRKAGRETVFTDLHFYAEEDNCQYDNPNMPGHWVHELGPKPWDFAGVEIDREAFWRAFSHCTSKLPDKTAKVFLLREVDDMPTEAICETLGISANNLWVMLHRARTALRRCLETHWFADTPIPKEEKP